MIAMTKTEMDQDLETLRRFLAGTSLIVERCTQASTDKTVLWVFTPDGRQIAEITKAADDSEYGWIVSQIEQGLRKNSCARTNLAYAADTIRQQTRRNADELSTT